MITQRRWRAASGDLSLVGDVALWGDTGWIIGGRIYFDLTTPADIPHHWWGVFAVWSGGLGIWGAVALAAVVGAGRGKHNDDVMDPARVSCTVTWTSGWSPRRTGSCSTRR